MATNKEEPLSIEAWTSARQQSLFEAIPRSTLYKILHDDLGLHNDAEMDSFRSARTMDDVITACPSLQDQANLICRLYETHRHEIDRYLGAATRPKGPRSGIHAGRVTGERKDKGPPHVGG